MQLPKKLQPVTEKEILKEVADELKLNIKDVERTYDIWFDFVDYIANETDQAAISFPPLGKLYVSTQKIRTGMVTEKLKKFRENKMREIEVRIIEESAEVYKMGFDGKELRHRLLCTGMKTYHEWIDATVGLTITSQKRKVA